MEDILLKSWEDSDDINLVKEALFNTGPTISKLTDVKYQLKYVEKINNKRYRPTVHIGQRKLFLNELQFLNKHITKLPSRHNFVIYAGGSPGHHMYELSRYYPDVTFFVIDPSRHQSYISDHLIVEENKKSFYNRVIYYEVDNDYTHDLLNVSSLNKLLESKIRLFIIKDYCTSELLLQIKNELPLDSKIYLWSDIRTDNAEAGKFGRDDKKYRKDIEREYSVTDGDILWNLAMQYNWLKTLEPEATMFKFRLPFYTNSLEDLTKFMNDKKSDFDGVPELNIINDYNNKQLTYPKGSIYIQPWQGISSTESRLVIKKKNIYNLVSYDSHTYDDTFNYYNLIERVVRKHNNGKQFYKYGYCECNDCGIELETFKRYLEKIENISHIKDEFLIPKHLNETKVIGNLGTRLMCLLGTHLEGVNEHGINRF